MFDDYDEQLHTVFKYFSKNQNAESSITEDVTLFVSDMLNVLTKCKIIDPKVDVNQEDAVKIIEMFYAKGSRLHDKLTDEMFLKYYKENPLSIAINREIDAKRKRNAAIKKRREDHEAMIKQLMQSDPEAA